MGKWEFIIDALESLHKCRCDEALEDAKKIKETLEQVYGTEETEAWKRDVHIINIIFDNLILEKSKIDFIQALSDISYYCIACVTDKKCDKCRFAKQAGVCGEEGSLYMEFYNKLRWWF